MEEVPVELMGLPDWRKPSYLRLSIGVFDNMEGFEGDGGLTSVCSDVYILAAPRKRVSRV